MSSLSRKKIIAVLLFSLLTISGAVIARAQEDIIGGAAGSRKDLGGGASSGGGGGRVSVGGGSSGGRRAATRNTARTVVKASKPITTATTGALSVATTQPNVTIYLEPVGGGEPLKGDVGADERQFVFNRLKPGRYTVYAEGQGYTDSSEETVAVRANQTTPVTLKLDPVMYNAAFTIKDSDGALVREGNIRYAPAVLQGNEYVRKGKTSYQEFSNGNVTLASLSPGLYIADIVVKEAGYAPEKTTFTVKENAAFNVTLKRLETRSNFSASWGSLSAWEAPPGWRTESSKLMVSAPGVALPKDDAVRFYTNFELRSNVRMVNGVAASFIARATDARNYYLIQLTGASADEPFMLRGFVIKDGQVAQQLGSAPINSFSSTLQTGKFFAVKMKMQDNQIRVWITDSQTGDLLTLGILTDPYRTYTIGAVGIAARDREQNEVADFTVCYKECP
ncbi:MAG TPA: carboxypeptidase-like regulatory domain-containing protein [Pyrinomonadaceae bacterium]|nr:carboxypeptidase-like regulatory domain-containing protein [Pyrinomonadaceae bacterium]